jgi:threonine/homoserine/homoserine lactone efflux protein
MALESTSWLGAVVAGYVTGWLVAAPIGPVNLEIIRRTLRFGWRQGGALGAGAVLIDLLYFTAFSLGIGAVLKIQTLAVALDVFSAILLLWLGQAALRDAWRIHHERTNPAALLSTDGAPMATPTPGACFGTGLLMTGANPMTIAFWSALTVGFAAMDPTLRLWACLGVVAGCSTWVVGLVTTLTLARRRVGPRLFATVTAAGGLMVLWYAMMAAGRVLSFATGSDD